MKSIFCICFILSFAQNSLSHTLQAAVINLSSNAIRDLADSDLISSENPHKQTRLKSHTNRGSKRLRGQPKATRLRLEQEEEPLQQNKRRLQEATTSKSSKSGKGGNSGKGKKHDKQEIDIDFISERNQTPSPSSAPSSTPRPTLAIENIDGIDSIGDDSVIRTIRIENANRGTCMSFEQGAGTTNKVMMINCTESDVSNRWELLWETQDLFKIRHQKTQWCLPQNPEFPAYPKRQEFSNTQF